jgi:hypothetical protein
VAVEHDHQLVVVVGEQLADATGVGDVDLEGDTEHRFVERHAHLDVAHRDGEVVEARTGHVHRDEFGPSIRGAGEEGGGSRR